MKNWKKRYIALLFAALLILFAGIPFLIHCLFKLEAPNDFFAAEWTAGDFLQFYGALLAFCSSVILSMLALWQNETIRKESNKHTELLERMEIKNKMPLFDVGYLPKKNFNYCQNATVEIRNISENVALELHIDGIYLTNNEKKKTWDVPEYSKKILTPGNMWEVELKNPFLTKGDSICFCMTCSDLYGNRLQFLALGDYNSQKSTIDFQLLNDFLPETNNN